MLLLTQTPPVSHTPSPKPHTLTPATPPYGGWARVHYDGPGGRGAGWGRPVISISADRCKRACLLPFLFSCFVAPASSVVFV